MMQMLKFRSPSPKERDEPHAVVPPSPSMSLSVPTGPARPLRLVYSDEKGKFQMDPEAVAMLQLVKEPIGVVSVCGRARQGKSFILNQLLGRSSGFQVASTHRPCTKGLWMWSAPLKRTALDGTEYNLLLLDSEGIDAYDQTGTYSTQIFSLAVLLSSMFIYNQMGGIDEAALDRLSLVTEMTKHIRVRASGGRTTTSELGQFSPVFVWLLRDFYLDLAENGRQITPRDYLELALRPAHGGGRDTTTKNEIRESIRALFPDRECFTLVRPLNSEKDLQRLDQISLDKLRPEFRSGLDALTKYVFERTRPKQVGATTMTGPLLAGITQAFLDALNSGAVPTISSSWQSVEEGECRRAYDLAAEAYISNFDRSKPPEEVALREAHEDSVQKSLSIYNGNAVGAGSSRLKYEKLLQAFVRKQFEDYKTNAFREADLMCSDAIHNIEKRLRSACYLPDAKFDQVLKVLGGLVSEYEKSSHGPGKWQKLASFLQQSLEGPVYDLLKRQVDQNSSEMNALMLKYRANEDKLVLLGKQLETSQKHGADYLKRYEDAIADKKKISDDYMARITNLQSKYSSLEEKHSNLSKVLDSARQESADGKHKYEQVLSKQRAEEDQSNAEIAILKSKSSAAEARLAAAREQAQSAQEEASEWRRKYDIAVREAKAALEKAATLQERANKHTQVREDSLRAEFAATLAEKDEDIKNTLAKLEHAEHHASSLNLQLKAFESKLRNQESETTALKLEIKDLLEKLENVKSSAQSYESEARILEQERTHLEQRYASEFKRFEEAEERCKAAEKEAKKATELAEKARSEALAAQREKNEVHRLSIERLAQIERAERHVENLQRLRADLEEDVDRLRASEQDAVSKVVSLEARVEEREREIEVLLKSTNEQRASTVHVLENLLATERAARTEANNRAEALSLQLQSTQAILDNLQQEMTSVRLNESALDHKLKSASRSTKRLRSEGHASVQDMDVDMEERVIGSKGRKKSKSTTSPPKKLQMDDGGSVFKPDDDADNNDNVSVDADEYTKFTVQKLKQELTKHGFGDKLLEIRNPNKKDVVALYEKHVLQK
ncbi:hypothetical protein AMTRI_Chr01g133480 [Amborella trichopoda]